jgi:DNA-binding MarR family transcriptional regulator
MTGGRTKATRTDLRFESLVCRVDRPVPATTPSEQVALLRLADEPVSVAELAAELDLVIGVVNVLINDLLDAGLLETYESDPDDIELDALERIAAKIRSI